MTLSLFEAQRTACLQCGGLLVHPTHGRPRRYCDADCAAEGKRESDRQHMTPFRLAAMREAKARWTLRKAASRSATAKAAPNSTQEAQSRHNAQGEAP